MKLVVAIIKPHMVEAVTGALDKIEVSGITLLDVRGHGRQRGHTEVYRGGEYRVDFIPKVRVEVLTTDALADSVADTIVETRPYREDRRREALDPAHRFGCPYPHGRGWRGRAWLTSAAGIRRRWLRRGGRRSRLLLGLHRVGVADERGQPGAGSSVSAVAEELVARRADLRESHEVAVGAHVGTLAF